MRGEILLGIRVTEYRDSFLYQPCGGGREVVYVVQALGMYVYPASRPLGALVLWTKSGDTWEGIWALRMDVLLWRFGDSPSVSRCLRTVKYLNAQWLNCGELRRGCIRLGGIYRLRFL